MVSKTFLIAAVVLLFSFAGFSQQWPAPKAPAIPEADGYVVIPHAVVAPDPKTVYRVVFDGTKAAAKPDGLLPVLNAAGGVLNDLVVGKVPRSNHRLAIIFHGAAVDGILDNSHFRTKYGIDNPNLKVISALKRQGVELLVCGQHLAAEHVDPKTLSPDIAVASDAYLVLINYQNRGYALMLF